MKTLLTTLFATLLFGSYAQDIHFDYDASGNRVLREIINMGSNKKGNDTQGENNNTDPSATYLLGHKITIYPNPTKSILLIEVDDLENETGNIQITNAKGIVVLSTDLTSQNQLNITNYSSGIYILRIVLQGKSREWKIIKQD